MKRMLPELISSGRNCPQLLNSITGQELYPSLSKVALAMTTIPNSNTDCERTFSMVKEIQTDIRLDVENDLVCSKLACKLNQTCACYAFNPSSNMLSLAKPATVEYNKEHQKATVVTICTE